MEGTGACSAAGPPPLNLRLALRSSGWAKGRELRTDASLHPPSPNGATANARVPAHLSSLLAPSRRCSLSGILSPEMVPESHEAPPKESFNPEEKKKVGIQDLKSPVC